MLASLQEEDLLPLPVGMPETVAVQCNGVPGHYIVRSKRMVNQHYQEERPPAFAERCGKSKQQWQRHLTIAAVGVSGAITCAPSPHASPAPCAGCVRKCHKGAWHGLRRRMRARRCRPGSRSMVSARTA